MEHVFVNVCYHFEYLKVPPFSHTYVYQRLQVSVIDILKEHLPCKCVQTNIRISRRLKYSELLAKTCLLSLMTYVVLVDDYIIERISRGRFCFEEILQLLQTILCFAISQIKEK